MRLRRSLQRVPVVDLDGNLLYEIDKQTAREHLSAGRALVVEGRAIRMRAKVDETTPRNSLRARSLECDRDYVLKRTGAWYAEVG